MEFLGWIIKTFCAFYFQIYNQTFGRIINIVFPTYLFSVGKNSAYIIKRAIWYGFIFLNCYIISFFVTNIMFYRLLPLLDQEFTINFLKTQEGFLAKKVNYQNNMGICASNFNESLIILNKYNINKTEECEKALKNSVIELDLTKQFYFSSLTLYIPNMELNYRLGNFEFKAFVVDKYGDVFEINRLVSIFQSRQKTLFMKMLEFLGIKSPSRNIEIEIPLMENLPNNVMDIQGIFFEINERNILFEESKLFFKAYIQGLRHYIYYWYWTSLFICLNIIAFLLFISFLIFQALRYIVRNFVDNCCFCMKRKKQTKKEE